MKTIARIFISTEMLLKNPGKWWGNRHWLLKLIVILLGSTALSASSVGAYNAVTRNSADSARSLQIETVQELLTLKRQVAELEQRHSELSEDLARISHNSTSNEILGAEQLEPASNQFLIDELEDYQASTAAKIDTLADAKDKNSNLIFVPKRDSATHRLYQSNSEASPVVTTIQTDYWYVFLQKETDWYQIEIEDSELTGWIPAKLVQELP
jgi:TolA-binding protein